MKKQENWMAQPPGLLDESYETSQNGGSQRRLPSLSSMMSWPPRVSTNSIRSVPLPQYITASNAPDNANSLTPVFAQQVRSERKRDSFRACIFLILVLGCLSFIIVLNVLRENDDEDDNEELFVPTISPTPFPIEDDAETFAPTSAPSQQPTEEPTPAATDANGCLLGIVCLG